MKKLALSRLPELFAAIGAKEKLYIPADDGESARFLPYREGMELTKKLNTVRSAKDLFFPQVENLMAFQVTGKEIKIIEERDPCENFVLFGVRACDAASFGILDRVFRYAEPADTYYVNRREHGTVVALACTEPEETCFCGVFGIDATQPGGDVSAWIAESDMYFRANTEKGETLLSGLALLEDGDEAPVDAVSAKTRAILEKLPHAKLSLKGFDGAHMLDLFHSKEWEKLSESCLGCGTCTFVCPTCQCYDIREFDTGKEVKRFRCWDSCMYSDFTKMSAGQPRPTQLERFRQRFMHKLVYFPDNNDGVYGCVGCGRCLQKCPIHMNIVKVVKALGEEKQ